MAVKDYRTLVVQWHPEGDRNRGYRLILLGCFSLALLLAVLLTLIPVPEPERPSPQDIPERVARFISEQPEPPEPEVEPEPEPEPPPVIEPQPVVERERDTVIEEPLSDEEMQARERAEQSGLLALSNELNDMMDTSEVDAMVDTQATDRSEASRTLAAFGEGDTPAAAARAGAGEAAEQATRVGQTSLSQRELAVLTQEPVLASSEGGTEGEGEVTQSFANTGRTGEEVTLVFDQYKGTLYSLYNRARRRAPGLEGRLVLELTIAPSGEVSDVRVVSSELNNPRLEQRIRNRVMQFRFEQKDAEPITIVFPIEFLPS